MWEVIVQKYITNKTLCSTSDRDNPTVCIFNFDGSLLLNNYINKPQTNSQISFQITLSIDWKNTNLYQNENYKVANHRLYENGPI